MERNGQSGQEEPTILVSVQKVNSGSFVVAMLHQTSTNVSTDGTVVQLLRITKAMEDGLKSLEQL